MSYLHLLELPKAMRSPLLRRRVHHGQSIPGNRGSGGCLCSHRIPRQFCDRARGSGMKRWYRGSEAFWCLKYGGLPLQTERTAPTDRRRFRFRSDKAVCLGMETTFPPLFESHSSSLTPRSPRGSPLPWVNLPPFTRHDSLLRKQHRVSHSSAKETSQLCTGRLW